MANMGLITCAIICIILILIIVKLYIKLTTGWCRSNVCLNGKTAIITGANTGIGYETAEDFAKRGARVILACRDPAKGQEAVARIIKATDNENVVFKLLDLASLKSVKDFAEDINKTEKRLDILVNNAGALGYGRAKSDDGLLLQMQVNYFGPFLLTNLLLDLTKKTPNSRIVNVSSIGAKYVRNFDVNNLNNYPERGPDFARSKLCINLFTIGLAARLRGTGVTTYSLHPGTALTGIYRKMPTAISFFINQLLNWFFKTPLEAAQTTIYCSVAKGIECFSGEHFADCRFVNKYKTVEDPDLPKKLWVATEEVLKIKRN